MKIKFQALIALLILSSNFCWGQDLKKNTNLLKIDSLSLEYALKNSKEAYKIHHSLLNKSKQLSYNEGILMAYDNLIFIHGNRRNLDSVLKYSDLFDKMQVFDKHKDLQANFLFSEGEVYNIFFGLTERGMESYTEAYKLKETKNLNETVSFKYVISNCYLQKKQYDKAIELIAEHLEDTISISPYLKFRMFHLLGSAYQLKKMPEKSMVFLNKNVALAKQELYVDYNLYTRLLIFYNYYLNKDYERAIDSSLAIKNEIAKKLPDVSSTCSEFLAEYYEASGDIKTAIKYIKEAINTTTSFNELPDFYSDLAKYYEINNQSKLALEVYKEKQKILDSIRSMEQKAYVNYYDSKLSLIDVTKAQKKIVLEKENLESQNIKQKDYITSLATITVFLTLVITLIIFYRKYDKSEEKLKIIEQKKKEQLKNHIKVRENELSALLISHSDRMNQLREIKATFSQAVKNKDQVEIIEIEKSLSKFMGEQSGENFLSQRIQSQYPGIVHELKCKHKTLTSTDIKHCIFIKLGLSIKESAKLLNVTTGTVKTARNRARIRMSLSKGVSLKDYINTFELLEESLYL